MVCAFTGNRDLDEDAAGAGGADRFDITAERGRARALTFGAGVHYCLGANLARVELQEATRVPGPRMRGLELDGEPVYESVIGDLRAGRAADQVPSDAASDAASAFGRHVRRPARSGRRTVTESAPAMREPGWMSRGSSGVSSDMRLMVATTDIEAACARRLRGPWRPGAGGAGRASAQAGEYHVYSCRTPSGESAPADGWSGSVAAGARTTTTPKNTCSQPAGALIAALGDQTTHIANTDIATWAFEAPAGETIAGATLWRAGDADGRCGDNATYQFWLAGPTEADVFDECLLYCRHAAARANVGTAPVAAKTALSCRQANLGAHLYVNASCGGVSGYKCKEGDTATQTATRRSCTCTPPT